MTLKKWINITVFSIFVVAVLGVLLRYKITFSLPLINQKNLQESHSYFALTGWITQIVMVLLSGRVSTFLGKAHFNTYNPVLLLNLIAAYGMLLSFLLQGYGVFSICFSICAILAICWFAVRLWTDMVRAPKKSPAFLWYKAALVFAVLSTFGILFLFYLMYSGNRSVHIQQATSYYYLHFQYNGFFIFACFGLFTGLLKENGLEIKHLNRFFWIYAPATTISYFLSTLWMHFAPGLYVIIATSGVVLSLGWIWYLRQLKKHKQRLLEMVSTQVKWLFILSGLAYTVKVLLQTGSIVPALNNMAFGYRPIVIGYLHLVFLAVLTIFILGYLLYMRYIPFNKLVWTGIVIFIVGIIANEGALMIQGLVAMDYRILPFINDVLFTITGIMLVGAACLNWGIHVKDKAFKH